jgi:hypothetical protein
MIASIAPQPLDQLRYISNNSDHPFQQTADKAFESMRVARDRFNVGAFVTTGETGAASAAMDLGARMHIPLTGFAPRGKFNEAGPLKAHHASVLLEPDEKFSILTAEEARLERKTHAPYARKLTIREAEELNARHSSAVLVISAGELALTESVDFNRVRLMTDRSNTLVCNLDSDPLEQSAQIRDFLRIRKPWFLNIVGPGQSLSQVRNYTVYEKVMWILDGSFREAL